MYKVTTQDATHRPKQYLSLVSALSLSEFKLRYFDSVLGYFWTLARPLMLFGVLYVVFTNVVKLGAGVPFFAVVILMAIVLWFFFAEATSTAVSALVNKEGLIRKMSFPLSTIPISITVTAGLTLFLNLIAVVVFMLISGVSVRLSWLEFPFLVVALIVVAVPLTLLLSVLFVRFRDVQHIWDVLLQAGFYGTPIIYPIEKVPEDFQRYVLFNPIAAIIEQTRHAVIDPGAPSTVEVLGGPIWLLIPVGIVVLLIALSYVVFRREAPKAAELI